VTPPADWNDTVKLTTNIDMGGCTWSTTIADPTINTWVGTFDGAGHVVSGLDISVTSVYAGFIAYMGSGGTIKDFGFTGDVTVNVIDVGSASPAVGGLVGWTMPSSILRSFATGDVTVIATATDSGGNADSYPYVGGLVGNLEATLSDSYATGDVSVTAGLLQARSATSLGTGTISATGITSSSGAVDLNGFSFTNPIVIGSRSAGPGAAGALQNTNTASTSVLDGNVSIGGENYVGGNGSITFNGVVSGGGSTVPSRRPRSTMPSSCAASIWNWPAGFRPTTRPWRFFVTTRPRSAMGSSSGFWRARTTSATSTTSGPTSSGSPSGRSET
jgi:hypothetical protein